MTAPTALITRRGDTFHKRVTLTVTDPDTEEEEAYDLTDCTLWFTVKVHSNDADDDAVIAAYWEEGGNSSQITVADPTAGVIEVTVTADEMDDFAVGRYYWDLQLLDAGLEVTTIDDGTFDVVRDITRRVTVG